MQQTEMPVGPTPDSGAVEQSKGIGVEGVVQVFTSPEAVGKGVSRGARILVPWLILIVISFGAWFLMAEPMIDTALSTPEGRQQMQEQLDQAPQMTEETMRQISIYSTMIFAGLMMSVIAPLIIAAIMLFFGNFVFAGTAKYKQLLAIALFTSFITAVGQAVYGIAARLTGNGFFSISLGFLAPEPGQQSALFQFLSLFDLFFIWQIIAAGIALSVVYNFSRNKGYLLSVISIGGLGLIGVGLTALFA